MCPVRSVTYVSGRSLDLLTAWEKVNARLGQHLSSVVFPTIA